MTRFVQSEDRIQGVLLPEYLDDYVAEDNPVRVIDVSVDELDLGALGFDGVIPEASRWQSSTNSRNTDRKAARLSRRKSAMVLKSGFRLRSSQITSMLRWLSVSSRRLDRTRFK